MNKRSICNIKWALHEIGSISPKMFCGIFVSSMIHDGIWFFSSALFIKKIVYSLFIGEKVNLIVGYVLCVGLFFLLLSVALNYVKHVVNPLERIKIYKRIYEKLYSKSLKVDLSCFDNHDFYSHFTMALDGADQKIVETVEHFASLLTGSVAAILILNEMVKMDLVLLLFLVIPLFSSFNIEIKLNAKRYERYVAGVHADKLFNYINRVMYLPQYAKDMRTSNVFKVIGRQFEDATIEKSRVNVGYAKSIIPLEVMKGIFTFVFVFEGVD